MDQKMISAANVSRTKTDAVSILYIVLRVIVVFAFVAMFIPSFNPGKVATEINICPCFLRFSLTIRLQILMHV